MIVGIEIGEGITLPLLHASQALTREGIAGEAKITRMLVARFSEEVARISSGYFGHLRLEGSNNESSSLSYVCGLDYGK